MDGEHHNISLSASLINGLKMLGCYHVSPRGAVESEDDATLVIRECAHEAGDSVKRTERTFEGALLDFLNSNDGSPLFRDIFESEEDDEGYQGSLLLQPT